MKKHRTRTSGSFLLRHLLLLTFLVITAYPLLWMVLAAFRLRFRPWADGAAFDGTDVALAEALAAAHPCVDAAPAHP